MIDTSNMTCPALKAMLLLSQESRIIVEWDDGERVLIFLDTFFDLEDNETGYEEWVIGINSILQKSNNPDFDRYFQEGERGSITSKDPPTKISTPDGSKSWKTGDPLPS